MSDALDYARPQHALVRIRRFGDALEANMALNLLQSHGIHAVLGGEHATDLKYGIGLTHTELLVPEDQADEALKILPDRSADAGLVCPRCESKQVHTPARSALFCGLAVLLLGLPLLMARRHLCRACGNEFVE